MLRSNKYPYAATHIAKMWLAHYFKRIYKVNFATTKEEKEAIYRSRYKIYVEERNRHNHKYADHQKRWIKDPDDELKTTILAYIQREGNVIASIRIRNWKSNSIPSSVASHYGISSFTKITSLKLCDISYLAVVNEYRGSLAMLAIATAAGSAAIRQFNADAVLVSCSPGLVKHYSRFGFRNIGDKGIHTDVFLLPMYFIINDIQYARQNNAFIYPTLRGLIKGKELNPLVSDQYFKRKKQILFYSDEVYWEIKRLSSISKELKWLKNMPDEELEYFSKRTFIISAQKGIQLTTRGVQEREAFFVLDGKLSSKNDQYTYSKGDIIGYPFSTIGRKHSISASSSSRLIVISQSLFLSGKSPMFFNHHFRDNNQNKHLLSVE